MYQSMRALLAHLIDYAGLFPPASLPLAPAVAAFLDHRRGPHAWMLGRFVCPSARLAELAALVPPGAGPIPVAALGRRPESPFAAALAADLAAIAEARAHHRDALAVGVLELPLPPGPLAPDTLALLAAAADETPVHIFCELSAPLDDAWEAALAQALPALAAHNAVTRRRIGFKLRTGGVTADAIPGPAQVAAAVVAARDAGLAMKCTAGLHHPVRQFRHEVGAPMHGFLNLFVGAMLAHAHRLGAPALEAILADEDPAAFRAGPDGLAWRDLALDTAAVVRLRREALVSFGSCSFDEPRDDLRALGVPL